MSEANWGGGNRLTARGLSPDSAFSLPQKLQRGRNPFEIQAPRIHRPGGVMAVFQSLLGCPRNTHSVAGNWLTELEKDGFRLLPPHHSFCRRLWPATSLAGVTG